MIQEYFVQGMHTYHEKKRVQDKILCSGSIFYEKIERKKDLYDIKAVSQCLYPDSVQSDLAFWFSET